MRATGGVHNCRVPAGPPGAWDDSPTAGGDGPVLWTGTALSRMDGGWARIRRGSAEGVVILSPFAALRAGSAKDLVGPTSHGAGPSGEILRLRSG